jgi:cytochrome P450
MQASAEANDARTPFDIFNAGDGFRENPFPTYKLLRDETPLLRNSDGSYTVSRYADVAAVLSSPNVSTDKSAEYRKVMGEGPIFEFQVTAMGSWDPPRHGRIRKSLARAFTPRAMAQWEPLVRDTVDELLRECADAGKVDLVDEFSSALPLVLICKMLGVTTGDRQRFRIWANSITTSLDPGVGPEVIALADQHAEEWKTYFGDLIAFRRRQPGDDLVSMLLATDEGEEPFSDLALLHNLALLLSGGHETTTNLITSAVNGCLENPGEAARLRNDRSLIPSAVEEFLRYESPVQMGARRTTAPIALSGGTVPEGVMIWTLQGAANRDERQFADPERLDVGRAPNRHLAFITGIHVCLGAPLARLEARVALERLVCDFPGLHLTGTPERHLRTRYRGFRHYPVSMR